MISGNASLGLLSETDATGGAWAVRENAIRFGRAALAAILGGSGVITVCSVFSARCETDRTVSGCRRTSPLRSTRARAVFISTGGMYSEG